MTYVEGLRAVVTGAGSGIGAAIAARLASAGARVVVNDLDADRAHAVAASVGGFAAPGDAAGDEGAAALVRAAREAFGGIDLFVANAGVAVGGGPEAPDHDWDLAWQVNTMAHVRAARHVLPEWLERGRGHFVATVSAAGLLTMPGAAPYAVTKHAALAFAEWMAVTYGGRGVRVQALCPQGVRTPMLAASGDLGRAVLERDAVEPDAVAELTVTSLEEGPFLLLPHPEVAGYYGARAADPDAWLAGMRRMTSSLPRP